MKSLGSHFKRKREEEGYTIDEVADATNIASRHIEAIEEHDFSQFPADVYAKGFIRSYANFLDLDAQSLVMEYSLNFEDDDADDSERSSSRKFIYWTTIALIAVAGFFLVLLRFAWHPTNTSSRQSTRLHDPAKTQVQVNNKPDRSVPVAEESDELKLKVVASAKTWVYAIFDGLRKQEYMFQPGDEMTWKAEDTIRLRMGNAGGLQLYHDGKSLPKLGATGEVADRIITLNDNKIEIKSPGR